MTNRRLIQVLAGTLVACALLAACGDGDDVSQTVKDTTQKAGTVSPTKPSKSTGGTSGGPDKVVMGVASQYAPELGEVPGKNKVNVPETFAANLGTFASSYLFPTNKEGEAKANEWKIVDGYQVAYQPEGLAADLLRGRYYTTVEVYLFHDIAGSSAAFTYMDQFYRAKAGSEVIQTKLLGNQSSAFKIVNGTVGTSAEINAFYRMLVRRGNVVFVAQVNGADGRISVDEARNIAIVVDDRILGNRAAPVPTPIPTPSFGGR